LNESLPEAPDVTLATSWAWYFEGERFFEGFREFFTAENIELPLLNGYRLLGRLGATRLELTSDSTWDVLGVDDLVWEGHDGSRSDAEVDGLAALDQESGTVTVLVWNHQDDQYAMAPDAEVAVTLRHLPFAPERARVRHWRIDTGHSNAYTAWQEMGRPQDPTPEQLAALKARQGIEEGNPVQSAPDGERGLRLTLDLPLHALSLLEIRGS
jgi:xylan 1,4-beta-xylosidase